MSRLGEAPGRCQGDVPFAVRSVHRLEKKGGEREAFVERRLRPGLWVDELQFMARRQGEVGPGLGADGDPVEAGGCRARAVRLDGDLEAFCVERRDERVVDLEERLAPGADDEWPAAVGLRRSPGGRYRGRERSGVREPAAARSVDADEIGVAEAASGRCTVLLASRPEVAAREAKEDGGAARLRPFALERGVDLLDRVAHGSPAPPSAGSGTPASRKPFARSWHESQRRHGAPSGEGS